eukprot:12750839-Alexandrium_andersonii.AAC.1
MALRCWGMPGTPMEAQARAPGKVRWAAWSASNAAGKCGAPANQREEQVVDDVGAPGRTCSHDRGLSKTGRR